jgi:hypothetical protein
MKAPPTSGFGIAELFVIIIFHGSVNDSTEKGDYICLPSKV